MAEANASHFLFVFFQNAVNLLEHTEDDGASGLSRRAVFPMLKTFSRSMLVLGLLGTAPALAIKVSTGSPFAAPSVPKPAAQTQVSRSEWQEPVLELLVTVSALRDASLRSDFAPQQPETLSALLAALRQKPTLSAEAARQGLTDLRAALGSEGLRQLDEARAHLERRAARQLASSRIARDETLPPPAFYRLALQVPGGQAVVSAVQNGQEFNPFAGGIPAVTLRLIEARLKKF